MGVMSQEIISCYSPDVPKSTEVEAHLHNAISISLTRLWAAYYNNPVTIYGKLAVFGWWYNGLRSATLFIV